MGLTNSANADASPRPRRGKWLRRMLTVLLLLALLVGAAPWIISQEPVLNGLLGLAVPQLKGQVHIKTASLGWLSAPVLGDIEVRDAEGRPLLQVLRVELSKTPLELLGDVSDLGEVRLIEPSLSLVCAGGKTNLEEALAPWLQPGDDTASPPPLQGSAVRIEIEKARVVVQDQDTGKSWTLAPLGLSLAVPQDRRTPIEVRLSADSEQAGRLDVDAQVRLIEKDDAALHAGLDATVQAEGVPLALARAVLCRFEPALQLAGEVRAQVKLHADDVLHDTQAAGIVGIEGLVLAVPTLSADTIHLKDLETPFNLARRGNRITVSRADLSCDVGKVSLAGTVDLDQSLSELLVQPGQHLDVQADLARLVSLLPHTVALPPHTSLVSGGLTVHLESKPRPQGVLWEGRLNTADLEGLCEGKKLLWKKPISLTFAAHQAPAALPVFEHFVCTSDFLQMEVSGSVRSLSLRARLDLERLGEHAQQLFDLGSTRLGGQGQVQLTAAHDPSGQVQVKGDVRLDQLHLVGFKGRTLHEDSVTAQLELAGRLSAQDDCQVDRGSLRVQVGRDTLAADLAAPLASLTASDKLQVRVALGGDLARWQGRLGCVGDYLDGMQIHGQGELSARLHPGEEALDFEDLRLVARGFRFVGMGLNLDEPVLELTSAGQLVWTPTRLDTRKTHLSCPTLSASWPSLSMTLSAAGLPLVHGDAAVQADLARLYRCLMAPPAGVPDTVTGRLAGQVVLRPAVEQQDLQVDLAAESLTYGPATAPSWREPRVHLVGQGSYDCGKDLARIVRLHVESSVLSAEAAGQVAQVSQRRELTLAGQVSYDLARLEPQLRPYLGQGARLVGRDSRPFRIAGPLASSVPQPLQVAVGSPASAPAPATPPELLGLLTGELGLSWQTVQAYGADVGAAEVRGRLDRGLLAVAPVEAAINQGRLRVEPFVRLSPGPRELTLGKGRVVDHAHLTPAVCASALGYALPALAGVAQVQGEVSVDTDGVRVPLADPTKAIVAGQLTIHSAQVGPGPLVRELTVLLRSPSTLTIAHENAVPFQVVQGRIYHRNLELQFPDLTIRTSGSVGLDGTLALVADMPVPPKWLPANEVGRALGKQTIRLPIGGTLAQPRLDQQALRTATERYVREAARDAGKNLLRTEVGNELNRIFRKR